MEKQQSSYRNVRNGTDVDIRSVVCFYLPLSASVYGRHFILQRYCGKENGRGTGIRQKAAGSICQKEESVAVRYYS